MASYLIGYDLKKPDRDYEELFKAIKSLSGTWWHQLDSTWIIKHNGPAEAIRDFLMAHMDDDDTLLVVKLSGEGAWLLNKVGSDWLVKNL